MQQPGPVEDISTFVSKDSLDVPIRARRSDRETLETLRMWYPWLQSKRGLGEMLLLKKMVGLDKVRVILIFNRPEDLHGDRRDLDVRAITQDTAKLEDGINAYGFERSGANHIFNLEGSKKTAVWPNLTNPRYA